MRGEAVAAPLTVVIPATDRPPTLARCLAALEASTDPPEQIMVVEEPLGQAPAEARNRGGARRERRDARVPRL